MPTPNPCLGLTGAMRAACDKAQQDAQGGNSAPWYASLFASPGSDWWRHAVIRVAEVVIGTAMVIAGVRALTRGSDTVKVIAQGAQKVGKKI